MPFSPQLESDVQRRAERLTFALRFERTQFRLADFVMTEIENGFFVVTLDWENFLENCLQSVGLPFRERDILLQEVDIRIELNLNQVWGLDRLLDASEVNPLCPVCHS